MAAVAAAALLLVPGIAAATPVNASGPTGGGTAVTVEGLHFVQLSVGGDFTLGLTSAGTVYAWGLNSFGQLGVPTSVPQSTTPILVQGGLAGETVSSISAGNSHGLAIVGSGPTAKLYSWGLNSSGQLGNGSNVDSHIPSEVSGMAGVSEVSAGSQHSLARIGGALYAWGYNSSGQLGDGTTVNKNTPVAVRTSSSNPSQLTGVTRLGTGGNSDTSFALVSGAAFGWGWNSAGQIGDGTNVDRSAPVPVHTSASDPTQLAGVDQIAIGLDHTLAIVNGAAYAWGSNLFGALGDGTIADRSTPAAVHTSASNPSALSGVSQIAAGVFSSFAIANGTAYSWGMNQSGELGDGTNINRNAPVAVHSSATNPSPLSGVTFIAAGGTPIAIVGSGGSSTTRAWGYNATADLGDGTTISRNAPVLSANFVPTSLSFGNALGLNPSLANGSLTATSPAGVAGTVALTGTANVFGGTAAASPATVSWNAGSFTYLAPSSNGSSSGSANLAATGADPSLPLAVAVLTLLAGAALLRTRRRGTE